MKKLFTLSAALCATLCVNAQFSDDFEAYTVGQTLGPQSPDWTTWSNADGGSEDCNVVNNDASSGTKSIYFSSTSASGGPSDVVLNFGGAHNTGTFVYEQDMKIESGKGGYFNFQANTTIGQVWALEVYFNQSGQFQMSNTSGVFLTGTFPTNTWFTLTFDINLNQNVWDIKVNNASVGSFANTVNQIASIDIFPVNASAPLSGNNQAGFWIDDVSWTHTPYVLPSVNAAVTAIGCMNPATRTPGNITGIVGQTRPMSATIRNLGVNPITSFSVAMSFNANVQSQNVTAVNIPSLGVYHVTFNVPVTLIAGVNTAIVTVSNVNGIGPDGDLNDDVNTANGTVTTVPAPGKVVVGEEGTGTWCQWCPRGAVFMDYMAENYDGFWAGVAVHNGDPMVNSTYDTGIGAAISGYPSGLVDRGPEADPSDFENEFLSRVVVAPHALIENGAQWNSGHDTLFVSVTYTFTQGITAQYKALAILTEDSVTGTSGYNQSNAYANNAAGPMGGFESLPSSVPASQMNYNHVARGIAPSFAGTAAFFGTTNASQVLTVNFAFPVSAGWDTSMFHVIGVLVTPTGTFDNAGTCSIGEALSNGYVPATAALNVAEVPSQPEDIKVYPNPSTGMSFVELNLESAQEVTMTVRDITGKVVATRNYGTMSGANILPINTSEFAKGMYTVEVLTGETLNRSQMIVE
jgi:hypothetical protein